jgi:homoserine/homoserine lactone efflux protein
MSIETWLAFAAASAVLLIIPGPTILTVISYSLTHGRSAAISLIGAVALGDSTALVLSLVGLGSLLAASAMAFTIVKWLGGAYLIYLGVKMLRAGLSAAADPATRTAATSSRWNLFVNTYAVTATNPKGIIFFMAFLPQFVDPAAPVARQMWILAVTFVALAIVNATLYTVFAGYAASLLISGKARRWFNFGGGSLLSAAGIWTLLARRAI